MKFGSGIAAVSFLTLAAVDLVQGQSLPQSPKQLQFAAATVELPEVAGRRFELASGPQVFVARDATLPLIEISLALRVGAFLDPTGKSGLAYLTATQMRRGGAGELDADTFDNRADDLGARIRTLSSETRAGASVSVPAWNLEPALDLFFAMLSRPRFQADRLASARSNLLESMKNRNVEPLAVLEREWQWLMCGEDHFTSRPMTPTTLAAITPEDLDWFHREYWQPGTAILAVSGDFEPVELLQELDRRFADWSEATSAAAPPAWPPPAPGDASPPGLYHYEMDIPQAKVLLGRRLPKRLDWTEPERFALLALAEILGGQGAISRIAGRLRTAEGLVYRASATIVPGDLWPGDVQVFFETKSGSTARAVKLALEEVERLRTEPVHPTELDVVKQTLLARLRLGLDTSEEIAGYFAEDALLDRPFDYRQTYYDDIDRLQPAEIQAAARQYLRSDTFLYLTVGRWEEIAGTAGAGKSTLERTVGHTRTLLPERDPFSLEPMDRPE